ncbi:MAG TPA: S-layer homology domain-containing protein [Bacillota bacterium]|nr:S-layer homology domain-containing protein [Bacillota bacterium]
MASMILGSAAVTYAAGYPDVKTSNWAYDAVNAMSDRAIVKGYPDGSFKPDHTVTYGEFIKMALTAATGEDVGNAASGSWALNYYNKALELKYFTVYDIDKSQLDQKITRAHMALIISSILGDVKIDGYDEIQKGITDITYETEYEYDITKAYATGILTGYTDSTFKPDKTLSRAEAATVIYRLVDESKRILPGAKPVIKPEEGTTAEPGEKDIRQTSEFLDMAKLTMDKIINDSAKITDKCEFYADASVWGVKLNKAFGGETQTCSFDSTLKGLIYLVKDGEIVDIGITFPMVDENGNELGFDRSIMHYDVSKADYIISIPVTSEPEDQIIKIVQNPLKK